MILVFDTETSGVYQKALAADHPEQGHIMQLACLLMDDKGAEQALFYSLVKPEVDYVVNPGAFAAHGITKDECEKTGVELQTALKLFQQFVEVADVAVAHNIKFDRSIVLNDSAIISHPIGYAPKKEFCTMEAMTPICKLPSKWKGTEYKWPKLEEAFKHCFNFGIDNAHDALSDVRATAQVYLWLKARETQKP